MARLEYFLVAESVSVDQQTNRISFFNVVEQVTVPEFPVTIPQIIAVAAWNAEEGDDKKDFQATVRITSPSVEPKEFHRNFRMPAKRIRVILVFQGIKLAAPGKLLVELSLNDKHEATHSIDAELAEGEQG
jgi:hypothetical protein